MSQLKIFDGVEVRLKSSVEVTHFTIKLQFIIFIRFLLMFRRWIQLNDLIFPLMTILHKTNLRQQKHLSCQGSHIQLCHPQKNIKKWWATGNDSSSQGTDDKNNEKFGHK